MSRRTLERVLEDIRHFRIERVRLIGGGEPTLHPEFPTYVRLLAREAKFLSITTNAHWPSVEIPQSLIDAPVDLVEISIDAGGKAQYEASRVRGNYEVLMGNLERLYKMRNEAKSRTMINIRLMVRPSNKFQLQDDIKLYKRYSDTVMQQYLQSVELLNYNEDVYTPVYHHSQETPKCSMPFKQMEVLWNGDIPLCGPNWRGAEHKRLHLDNIHENTLGEIWNGETYKQYRRAHRKRIHADMPVCQGCVGV